MASLEDLNDSLEAVRSLIDLESNYGDPPSSQDRRTAFALRGASVVLTVAAFEAFLRSLFEEQLQRIAEQNVPLTHFPGKLRVEAMYASLELAMKGNHESRGLEKLERLAGVTKAAKIVAADSFSPRAMADTQSNPNAACVTRMFRTIGLSGIFQAVFSDFERDWGKPVALTYPETRLNALVQSRHQVAHSADAAHVTRAEMSENVEFTSTLASLLSDALRAHISNLILTARRNFFEEYSD